MLKYMEKRQRAYFNKGCQLPRGRPRSRFRLATVCTPTTLMEEMTMKETPQKYPIPDFDPETYTDPILEEYYQIKREFNAEFNSLDELHDYLVAQEIEERKKGQTYLPVPPNLARYPHQEDDASC